MKKIIFGVAIMTLMSLTYTNCQLEKNDSVLEENATTRKTNFTEKRNCLI